MRFRRAAAALLGAAALATTTAAASPAVATARPAPALHPIAAGCASAPVGSLHCHAQLLATPNGAPFASNSPSGYGPPALQSAYALAAAAAASGGNQTVGIVDAFDDPNAESDLATYRSTYGLPACTSANGCLRKVNQSGGAGGYPPGDGGWGLEISLDLDMVSAICPSCHILLVEANDNTDANLFSAVDTAARLGATEISNSYGGGESSGETASDVHFNHPGVPVTVSSGDSGYGVEYPAASSYVTAVGGTSLNRAGNARGWSESAWSGAGSGCSGYEPKPAWQHDGGCAQRSVADVAAVADPNTGVAVYDTYNYGGSPIGVGGVTGGTGWMTVGGTSASAPIIAGVYALAGNGASTNYGSFPYGHTGSLNDITSGSNAGGGLLGLGGACSDYQCTSGPGYDGPTGNGTPNGTGGF